MSAIEEVRRRSRFDTPELVPHTAGAEDPETSPEMLRGMVDKVLDVGYERRVQLEELEKKYECFQHMKDGTFYINHCHVGQYADFHDRANHKYLKEKFPWLHDVSEGLGFDEDKGIDSHGSFEAYLGAIPHEDWTAFFEEMEHLEGYPVLDEEGASELEMEEQSRWVTEDGGPDLIKTMVKEANDAYESYLLSKVTMDLVWEWMRETEHYPEAQGQGDVWMDMEKLGKEDETAEWFLERLDDDTPGWTAERRKTYDDAARSAFEQLLKRMAAADEQVAYVYNRLDEEAQWQLFLQAFPDERRSEDDPYWYFWKPYSAQSGIWAVGYEPESHGPEDWKRGYQQAIEHLEQSEWFWKLVKNWFQRGPENHPELKFEALERQPDPDDPALFMRYGGGLSEEVIYEDDRIRVLYPRNVSTLNHHLLNGGESEIDEQAWRDIFKYKDIFVIQAKPPVDMLGKQEYQELGVVIGDSDIDLRKFGKGSSFDQLLAHPEYGRSIRRMLLRYYRERATKDSKAAQVLLQLGGGREIRRGERRGEFSSGDLGVAWGLYYIAKHKYKLAAKAFKRSPSTLTSKGVWLYFDSVEDLTPCFKNEDAATTVFAHDHYDWFDHYYDKANLPAVKDVIEFLSPEAIQHIREVLVNRRVYFPDGGPNGEGEYMVLTPKNLKQFDDATILSWLADPSDEDEEDGVFDDIIEAIQLAGVDILTSASQDSVYTGWIKAAVDAIDGKEHKWVNHPTKKYKSGEPMEAFKVFVPWKAVQDWATKYRDEHGYNYDGDLESLAVEANTDTVDPDASNYEAGWRDVNKEWAKENLQRIFDLTAPDPIPGSENYEDPAQVTMKLEALDEPQPHMFSGIPVELENRVKAVLADSMAEHDYAVQDLKLELLPSQEHSEEDIDASDGRLYNHFPAHRILLIRYRAVPFQDWSVTQHVFSKVREQVVNAFKDCEVVNEHIINPETLPEPESDDTMIFQFRLLPVDVLKAELERNDPDIPF